MVSPGCWLQELPAGSYLGNIITLTFKNTGKFGLIQIEAFSCLKKPLADVTAGFERLL